MNSGQRIGILVAALAILAGAFVLAQGSADDGGDDAPTARQVAEDPTVTGEGTGGATAPAATGEEEEEAPPPPPAPRVETIRLEGGGPAGEVRTLEYESGDTVRLRFRSDAAEEIHIHGYDRYVDVPAGGTARDRFRADAQGVFEIEAHGTGELLAELQVTP